MDRIECADFGEGGEFVFAEFGDTVGEVVDRSERAEAAFADERLGGGFAESAHVVEAQADGDVGEVIWSQGFGDGWFRCDWRRGAHCGRGRVNR